MNLPIPDLLNIIMRYAEPFESAIDYDALEFFANSKILFSGTYKFAIKNGLYKTVKLWLKKDKSLANRLLIDGFCYKNPGEALFESVEISIGGSIVDSYSPSKVPLLIKSLQFALKHCQLGISELLIDNGAIIENSDLINVLANYNPKMKFIDLLLKNIKTASTEVLHIVCMKYNSKFIRRVLNLPIEWIKTKHYGHILYFLASKNDLKTTKILLSNKIVLATDDISKTLFHCIENEKYKMFELVFEKYSKSEIRKSDGSTLLMIACNHVQYQIVKLLIQHGVDVNETNNSGQIALMIICKKDKHILSLLKKYNILISNPYTTAKNKNATKKMERLNILKLLLKNNVDATIKDNYGNGLFKYISNEDLYEQIQNKSSFVSDRHEMAPIIFNHNTFDGCNLQNKNPLDENPYNVTVV